MQPYVGKYKNIIFNVFQYIDVVAFFAYIHKYKTECDIVLIKISGKIIYIKLNEIYICQCYIHTYIV